MRYRFFFFVLLLSALSACAPEVAVPAPRAPEVAVYAQDAAAETASPSAAPARYADTLRLAMRPPATLNPLLNEDVTVDHILRLVFEPLVALDERLKPVGNLAEYNFSSDYASVVLTLQKGAVWSDYQPVTADDVLYSIGVLQDAPDGAVYKACAANILSCEKLDESSVKITYAEADSGSAYLLRFPLIPRHYYASGEADDMAPLGNGLYAFTALRPLEGLTLTRNIISLRPAAAIETVEAVFVPDEKTELYAFGQGLVDAVTMELTEWSRQRMVKKTRDAEYPAMYYDFIGFNFDHPQLRLLPVRQALAAAYDADEAVSRIYLSHAARALTPVHPASWLYDESAEAYAYAPDAARALLARTRKEEARAFPDDAPPLRLIVNEENDERVKIAESFAHALSGLGLSAQPETLPFDAFAQRLDDGDFDIFIGGLYLDDAPDVSFLFHSGGNMLRYANPALDALLEAAAAAPSESEHYRLLSEVQRHIAADLPVISLAFRHSAIITAPRVQGDLAPMPWHSLAGVSGWGLE